MQVKERVEAYLLGASEPRTLEEVAEAVSLTAEITKRAITELAYQNSDIVWRCTGTVWLCWRQRGDVEKESHVQMAPAAMSDTNCTSGDHTTPASIGPPSRRSRMPFKSPARTAATGDLQLSAVTPRKRPAAIRANQQSVGRSTKPLIKSLEEELAGVEEEMKCLADSYSEDELQLHIDKLHEYNEVKDMGQLLLGKLAEVQGTTTAVLYERFGLQLDD